MILELLVAVVVVEAATELVVGSAIFLPLRSYMGKWSFTSKLFTCGYCLSVWIAALVAIVVPFMVVENYLINFVIETLLFHRLANFFHELLSRYFKRLPWEIVTTNIKHNEEIIVKTGNQEEEINV
jgi:small basic protein